MKKLLLIIIIFTSFLSLFFSCDDSTGPGNNNAKIKLTLTLEDVSCTEVWLKLQIDNPALKNDIILYRDNKEVKRINILGNDTIIYDENLIPNKEYTYIARKEVSEKEEFESGELIAKTMDTTSQNFTWQTFTFSDAGAGSSVLYDVAIINENNIWAVGEIYMNDSIGNPDPTRYNAAIWNGQDWSLKRIPYNYQGLPFYNPIQSVFAFSENDIWFCGNGVIHFDGTIFIPITIPTNVWGPYQMNKIWGSSSSDLYIVGNNGNIAHYGGPSVGWKKIESGTDLNINDIWGGFNEKTQEWEILAVASNVNSSVERALIKISSSSSQIISSSPIEWSLRTIWFKSYRQYYIAGSGIYTKHSLAEERWANSPLDITTFYTNRIRGNNINDIIGVGAFGDLVHFNGWQWKTDYTQPNLNFGSYLSVDFKNNIVVAVGLEYNQAEILLGFR